ncbi:hypothetical protein CCR75_008613 [Bremia lactucae]|uniref:Protein kinase domain-containing protein n=1 Tax=Bremia lactucae TaxID=4779 RepID=A0A976FN12_BRELC|nr:hypothetical protein CCR75_008613 [Bremia lactucae]
MRRRLDGVIAEGLFDSISAGSAPGVASPVIVDTTFVTNGNTTTTTPSSNDPSLGLWLSISIPIIVIVCLFGGLFFYCKRRKDQNVDFSIESGSPVVPPGGRRKGTSSNRMVLTETDEAALASWRIDAEAITPIQPLGAGAYGTVWLATYLGETVVVKKLSPPLPTSLPRTKSWRKSHRQSRPSFGTPAGSSFDKSRTKARPGVRKNALRRFIAEIRCLATLSHPKIVLFYGVAWSTPLKLESNVATNVLDFQMVLEFMSGGDLRHYLAHTRSDVRARAWGARKLSMALDIAEAITYLHARQPYPLLHRDLKSSTILLDTTFTAKVGDFRMSRYGVPPRALRPTLSDRCPRGVATLMMECMTLEPTLRPTARMAVERLRVLLVRERRVSDIGDDVSTSDQCSFIGTQEDLGSFYSSSVTSSSLSNDRGFHYAVLEDNRLT